MSNPILRTVLLLAAVGLLSACSPATPKAGTTASPRTVELTMTDQMTFEPARIDVRRGETIRFVVRNASNVAHEAYVGTEEEQRLHATVHSGLGAGDQTTTTHLGYGVHVPAFGNGELVVTFDKAYEYVIGCHYPGHYAAGMRAIVAVTE
jgi:uncharacterized cupredoxin-like copper-binding protein